MDVIKSLKSQALGLIAGPPRSLFRSFCQVRSGQRSYDDRPFITNRMTYLGQAAREPITKSNVLSKIGDFRDESSFRQEFRHEFRHRVPRLRIRPRRRTGPKTGRRLPDGPQRNRTPRRPALPGRPVGAVDARRQPGEVAPRPCDLVLGAIPARRSRPRLQGLPPRLRLSVQFLLCLRRPAPRPRAARPPHPARRRRSHRLSQTRRCGRHQILQRDVRRQADLADPPPRSRLQSRAAASGADAHRHPACLRAEPDPAGL
jgi:hypothetical protein